MRINRGVFAALGAVALAAPSDKLKPFDYSKTMIRGVNLGGWFLTEPFISPSLYRNFSEADLPVDEYHLTQRLGKETAREVLEQHWDQWITEDDIAAIARAGFNLVRIPIGYWAFFARDGDPYVQGQRPYLERCFEWLRKYKLVCWIDLHGAPGSQNGFDNSGIRGGIHWQDPDKNYEWETVYTLQQIALLYGGPEYNDVVAGIELLNEPLAMYLNMDKLKKFYDDGYNAVRERGNNNVVIHDAYEQAGYFNTWMQPPKYKNIVLDHHHYQWVYPSQLEMSIDEHVKAACDQGRKYAAENLHNVVGEWSAALTDCQPWLRGVGRASQFDGSDVGSTTKIGSCEGLQDFAFWSEEQKSDTRRYIEAQLDAWEMSGGWIVWTWKTEHGVEWCTRDLILNGLFPQPLTNRKHPNQC